MRRLLSVALSLSVALAAQGKAAPAETETRTLEGRVVDVLGEPIPAATVAAIVGERVVQRATTDGEGIYRLSRVPVTGAEISFTAPGKAEVRTPWRLSAPAFRNEVLEDAGRLQGRVRDARGTPIAGATVVVVADRFWGEAITNGNGDFDLTAVPLRRALVRAWTPTGWVDRHVCVADGHRCDLQMPVLAAGTRVVRVKGLPPEALAAARVEVTSVDAVAHKNLGRVALRADGTAEFMPSACCLVQLVVPGFAAAPLGHFLCGGQAPIEFEVAPLLAARTSVKGRARDGRSQPVAGVRIVARDRSGIDLCSAVTDASGDFVLATPLPPDSFLRLGLELREWQLVDCTMSICDGFSWIQTTANPEKSRDLFLERTGDLRSELRSENGTRLVFADVEAIDVEHCLTRVRTVSDRAGKVDLRVPPGDYELIASASDGQITSAMVVFAEGQAAPKITWKPLPTGSIEGVLRDSTNQPMPGVELYVALQVADCDACARRSATVLTDRNGRFRCRGLTPGIWTVVGRHEDGIAGEARVTRDKSENIELSIAR